MFYTNTGLEKEEKEEKEMEWGTLYQYEAGGISLYSIGIRKFM